MYLHFLSFIDNEMVELVELPAGSRALAGTVLTQWAQNILMPGKG